MSRRASWYPAGRKLTDDPVVLDDGGLEPMYVMRGAKGLEAASWVTDLDSTPGVRGARWVRSTTQPKKIQIPIHLCAPSWVQVQDLADDLIDALSPEDGPGILKIGTGIGAQGGRYRCCSAVYEGGLEGNETAVQVRGNKAYWEFVVTFTQLDLWFSPEPNVGVWAPFAQDPWFPFDPGNFLIPFSGLTTVGEPLQLGGKAPSWPEVLLRAPFTTFRVTNDRTGESWEIKRGSEQSTDSLLFVTEPGRQSIRSIAEFSSDGLILGAPAYDQLNTAVSTPFAMRPEDTLTPFVVGAGPTTGMDVTVFDRWWKS